MVENYIDNSPAAARSNKEVVKILKSEILDLTCEKDMVAARIWYKVKHIGILLIIFLLLEKLLLLKLWKILKLLMEKSWNLGALGLIKV